MNTFVSSSHLQITATNIFPEGGGVITPLWVSAHDGSFDSFDFDAAASTGIEYLAEEGITGLENTIPGNLEAFLEMGLDPDAIPDFSKTLGGIFEASDASENGGDQAHLTPIPAGLFPGASATTSLELGDDPTLQNRYFSYSAMVFPSNDAFIGNEDPYAIELFDAEGNFLGADFIVNGDQIWDAGTEVNDESPTNIAFTVNEVGNSIDEGGTIQAHPGFLPQGSGGVLDFGDPPVFPLVDATINDDPIVRVQIDLVTPALVGSNKDDLLLGDDFNDKLFGRRGNDVLLGKEGDDLLVGQKGKDLLIAGNGDDSLRGGRAQDTLLGGKGDDLLRGGVGADLLTGGQGTDIFKFESNSGADIVTDLIAGEDLLDVSQFFTDIDQILGVGGAAKQHGGSTQIDLGGSNSILLLGVNLISLSEEDFILG